MGELATWTNRRAKGGTVRQVRNDTGRLALGPVWVVAGVLLCWFNAWWGIPLVLAGATQRRYLLAASPRLQRALSAQAHDAVTLAASGLPGARFCPTPHCGNRLPAAARFCPRCGTAGVGDNVANGTNNAAKATRA